MNEIYPSESRKKKSRNWEEDDFYDSDEDNFFDRTGTVEKKRNQRMKIAGKVSTDAETYDSLVNTFFHKICMNYTTKFRIFDNCYFIFVYKF